MKSARSNLVAPFSEEQKKAADELLAPQPIRRPCIIGIMPISLRGWAAIEASSRLICVKNDGNGCAIRGGADHLVPCMNACISSRVSLPSLLLSIALKIRS